MSNKVTEHTFSIPSYNGYYYLKKGTTIKVIFNGKETNYTIPVTGTYYIDNNSISRTK